MLIIALSPSSTVTPLHPLHTFPSSARTLGHLDWEPLCEEDAKRNSGPSGGPVGVVQLWKDGKAAGRDRSQPLGFTESLPAQDLGPQSHSHLCSQVESTLTCALSLLLCSACTSAKMWQGPHLWQQAARPQSCSRQS